MFSYCQSDFVTVHALFSLATLPDRLRPYVYLLALHLRPASSNLPNSLASAYQSSFFSLPVRRASGERLSHEEVVNKLDNETVSYECGLGISSYFAETFRVSIKVETDMYAKAVQWLKDLVYGAEFDKERYVNVSVHCPDSVIQRLLFADYRSLWQRYNSRYRK